MASGVVVPITAAAWLQASGSAWAGVNAASSGLGATGTDGATAPVVQHVHPQPGMSEKQVGDWSADRLLFALRNG